MFPQSLQSWRPDPLHLVEPGSPCRAVPLRARVRSHGHNNSQDLLKRLTLQGWPRVALPLFFLLAALLFSSLSSLPIGSGLRITQKRNAFEMEERTVMKIATQPKEKKEEARPLASLAESGASGGLVNCGKEAALESAVEELELLGEQLERENLALRDEVDRVSMFEEIVGTSPALQAVVFRAIQVAAKGSTVLIP